MVPIPLVDKNRNILFYNWFKKVLEHNSSALLVPVHWDNLLKALPERNSENHEDKLKLFLPLRSNVITFNKLVENIPTLKIRWLDAWDTLKYP